MVTKESGFTMNLSNNFFSWLHNVTNTKLHRNWNWFCTLKSAIIMTFISHHERSKQFASLP